VSRYGDDTTYPEDADPTNCDCADCGVAFWKSEWDSCPWCGPCAQRRDEWATAQDLKRMAKAVLTTDLTTIKEIA
jgi:hypothetical protein